MTRNSKFYDQHTRHGYFGDRLIPMRWWLPMFAALCTALSYVAYTEGYIATVDSHMVGGE